MFLTRFTRTTARCLLMDEKLTIYADEILRTRTYAICVFSYIVLNTGTYRVLRIIITCKQIHRCGRVGQDFTALRFVIFAMNYTVF